MEGEWIKFKVFPIIRGSVGEKETFNLLDKDDEQTPLWEYNEDKAFVKFHGTYVWRGVWESRLYFDDDEYWGCDLKEMSDLFEGDIVPFCEQFIKENNPHAGE